MKRPQIDSKDDDGFLLFILSCETCQYIKKMIDFFLVVNCYLSLAHRAFNVVIIAAWA